MRPLSSDRNDTAQQAVQQAGEPPRSKILCSELKGSVSAKGDTRSKSTEQTTQPKLSLTVKVHVGGTLFVT